MKDHQRKTKDPCEICLIHKSYCICEHIPKLELRTRVTLIVHYKELKRTTNTGRLAVHALTNSEMKVRGFEQNEASDFSDCLGAEYDTLFLFPSEDARPITQSFIEIFKKPIHLIVPDGNWRQASKVHSRHPEFKNIQRVKVSTSSVATHFLRKEHVPEGMATLEAIAEALNIIEGPQVGNSLKELYQLKLNQTLRARGLRADQIHT